MLDNHPSGGRHVGQITLRYWASARQAAGVASDVIEVSGPVSLAELLDLARALHPDHHGFSQTIAICSTLIDDRPVGKTDPATVQVPPGSTVELLPPFAGG